MSNTITDIIVPELPNLVAIISLNSNSPANNIQVMAMQELNYLEQHAAAKPNIATCDKNSIILAVKNVLRKNLSLDPSAGLVYVKTRNLNVGTFQNPVYKTVLEIQETVNGLISYNRQLGRVLDYTNPEIIKDANGKVIGVNMEILKPSYQQPRWEKYSYDESDFMRWRIASHKENSRGKKDADINTLNYANILYTSWRGGIDSEFARAKCIRHSLKKLGANSNEGLNLIPIAKTSPVIDQHIAAAEAEDNNDYTQHEEVASQINNNNENSKQPEQTEFNQEDL